MNKFNKILIANRGEIAVRIINAARELDIYTVAVYSEADKEGLHIELADEAWSIGEEALAETYLNVEKIIEVALESGCDAIHPGYGFLAENPQLVAACQQHHLTFIGPSVKAIQLMGNKIQARAFVDKLGVPMTKAVVGSTEKLLSYAKTIELPVLVKAAAGGGGKGMRIVREWSELEDTIESTSREALAYFGDGEVFIEKYVEDPRHIEIQILGDIHGNIIHLYERECSIQRRYQKIIEESPSPSLTSEVREKMGAAAVEIAKAIGYYSAGTIEFLVDKYLNFYFLEMNTRVQVEHPVTEMVTGVDIVQEQILIAAGETLSYHQDEIHQYGHAIEARVYAEEPENDFRPAPGLISFYQEPIGDGIRVDAGLNHEIEIKSFFDPMIAKLIVWDESREKARTKIIQALNDYVILGVSTNIPFMLALIQQDAFVKNQISTKYCDHEAAHVVAASQEAKNAINPDILAAAYISSVLFPLNGSANIWSSMGFWRMNILFNLKLDEDERVFEIQDKQWHTFVMKNQYNQYTVEVLERSENSVRLGIDDEYYSIFFAHNQQSEIDLWYEGYRFHLVDSGILNSQDFYESTHDASSSDVLKSPMPGKVIKVLGEVDGAVKKGDVLIIVEAMKMENNLKAPRNGKIASINVKEGDMVDGSKVLLTLEKLEG